MSIQFTNNKKLITQYPKCSFVELYIDPKTGKSTDFGMNFRVLVLNVWNGQTKSKSILEFEEDVIYSLKDKQLEKLVKQGFNKIVIKNEIKKFKNNEYYPTTVEPVKESLVEQYNLTELTKKVRGPIIHDFE